MSLVEICCFSDFLCSRIFFFPVNIGQPAEAHDSESERCELFKGPDLDAVFDRDFHLEQAITQQRGEDRLPSAQMEVHLLGSPIGSRAGVEDVEAPVVPTASGPAAKQRVSPISYNPPDGTREGLNRDKLNGIKEAIVTGSSYGHLLHKDIRIESVKDAQHFDRTMRVDKVDCPFVFELWMKSKQPDPDFV